MAPGSSADLRESPDAGRGGRVLRSDYGRSRSLRNQDLAVATKVENLQKVTQGIRATGAKYRKAVYFAVNSEAEAILTEAKILVPFVTGNLQSSARKTIIEGKEIFAVIEFLAPYARRVHEEPRPPSSTGTFQYLAKPLKDASSGYAERVARKVAKFMGGE
jgi:hypothetical protein